MPTIRILLLGPPDVQKNGQSIPIQRRVTRALLFYLASRNGIVGREELLTLFWEEENETIARSRLRETLSRLRAALPGKDLLRSDAGLVGLNLEKVQVDQLEFQNLIDQAGRLPWQIPTNQPLPEPSYHLLKSAAGIWRSPRFLAGADLPSTPALDEWRIQTGQRLEHMQVRVLERLSDHAYASGDLEEALRTARQALAYDELNEDLHFRVLRNLNEMGLRSEARNHFAHVQHLLRQELDTGPSPRLVDLYREIREDHPSDPLLDTPPRWTVRPSIETPFVGRVNVLSQLRRAFQKGGGVLVTGESGQGKTRLLQEFVEGLESKPRVLLTISRPAENKLPFQPVIELLRYSIRPDEWLELPPVWAGQISLILPELETMRPDLERPRLEFTPDSPADQARSLLMEAVRQLLLLISADRRLLICLDDAHWTDEATLSTLAYLIDRPPFDGRALLVLTARAEERNPHLDRLLPHLKQSVRFNIIDLTRLTTGEVSRLAQFVLGQAPSEAFITQLQHETGGNPLFILETLRAYLEQQPHPGNLSSGQLPLAKSIQTLIQARLQQLSPALFQVLEIAGIIGIEFDPEIIAHLLPESRQQISESLSELEQRRLVEMSTRAAPDLRYRFVHSKIREVLLQEIRPLRTRLLHGEVARTLEKMLGNQAASQAAVLADHYERAGEAFTAFNYWVLAGKRARHLLAMADAAQAFERARRLIPSTPGLSSRQIFSLYATWTEMAYEEDDAEVLRRLNHELHQIGLARKDHLLIGAALNGLSDASMVANQFDEGLGYANQAIAHLDKSGIIYEQMEAYNRQGVFLYMLNRVEESINSFQDALALGSEAENEQVLGARANSYYQIAVARTLGGWPGIGVQHARRSLQDFQAVGRVHGQASAYSALALANYFLSEYMEARKNYREGMKLAEEVNSWRMLGYLNDSAALTELALGNLDGAVEFAERAIRLGERYDHSEIVTTGYCVLGDLYLWLGDLQTGVLYFRKAIDTSKDQFLSVDPQFRLGYALSLSGEADAGLPLLQRAISQSEQAGFGSVSVLARVALAQAYLHLGKSEQAQQIAVQVEQDALRRRMIDAHTHAMLVSSDVALNEGRLKIAAEIYRRAADQAAARSSAITELHAQMGLWKVSQCKGQADEVSKSRIDQLLIGLQERAVEEAVRRPAAGFIQKMRDEIN